LVASMLRFGYLGKVKITLRNSINMKAADYFKTINDFDELYRVLERDG
jgi:hypothetical protein